MSRGRALLLAARPRTLAAAVAPVAVGTATAQFDGWTVRWHLSVLALAGAIAIQVGTNYLNDAFDFRRGADGPHRIGPQRAAASGLLTPRALTWAAAASFVIATGIGIPLVLSGGVPILALGLLSLLFGWAYTGGPYPLAYHGLGEVFVLVFFGLGAVGGTYWLHAHALHVDVLVAGLQNGFFACALLTVNNLRDLTTDRAAGKRTLVVRFGPRVGHGLLLACVALPFALNGWWGRRGALAAAFFTFIALLPALSAEHLVRTEAPSTRYNTALGRIAAAHLLFALILAGALFRS